MDFYSLIEKFSNDFNQLKNPLLVKTGSSASFTKTLSENSIESNEELANLENEFIKKIEVHLPDFHEYLYSKVVRIEDCIFHKRGIFFNSLLQKGIDLSTVNLLLKFIEEIFDQNYSNLSWTITTLFMIMQGVPYLKK